MYGFKCYFTRFNKNAEFGFTGFFFLSDVVSTQCSGLLNYRYAVSWSIPKTALSAKTTLDKIGLCTSHKFVHSMTLS